MSALREWLGIYPEEPQPFGLLAEFTTVDDLLDACEKVRDAGFVRFDAHSPIPVHGIDEAMGIRMSPIPWLVLGAALAGIAAGLLLQWWTNAVDYRFLISNKPWFALPPAFPITFETGVLFSAVTAVGALAVLCGWPAWFHPLFTSARFRRMTTDRYFISIEAADPRYDRDKTRAFLESVGATSVEEVVG